MSDLAAWNNFYVIVGSSAGALIGLQFVVMALIADRSPPRGEEAGPAFATPTIVHFGAVLLLSAVQSAPWQEVTFVAAILGLMGLSGVMYIIIVARQMRVQTAYEPEFGDWLYYSLLPWRHMQCSLYRHSRPYHLRTRLCLALELRRCCCFLSAFITPGIVSPTLYFTARSIRTLSDADWRNSSRIVLS